MYAKRANPNRIFFLKTLLTCSDKSSELSMYNQDYWYIVTALLKSTENNIYSSDRDILVDIFQWLSNFWIKRNGGKNN